ncbi:MAG: response regulator [Verrucomicrobiae bacterium]|nr:response regulator [Verrucomicrobiae bacterium]
MRILVVEDEAIVGRDIQASLANCGHTVKHVLRSGEAALEHLDNEDLPELVVMDVGLAGTMDGIETGVAIRERHSVPVLFLSAMSDEATLERAKQAGAYGYLLKPFNEQELHSMVEVAAARHASEQKLKATSARHLGTLTSIANAVIATDLIGRVTFLNPAAEAITGWTATEAQGRYVHEVFKISFSSGEAVSVGDDPVGGSRSVLLTTREGALLPVEDNTTPLRDSEGSLCGLVILFRLRSEDPDADPTTSALDTNTGDELTPWAQLAGMVTGIADPIIAVDPQWKITYVNEPAGDLLRKPRRELFSAWFWDQFPKSAHSRYYQRLHQALVRKEPVEFDLHLDALARWFQARCYPFANGMLILLTDITARKTADEQKSKIEKLESLGYLARGFAHDFNNLLTVLLGNLSIAGMRAPDDAPYRAEIDEAKRATLQAQTLVQQLLVFAKGGAPIRRRTDIGAFVEQWFKGHQRRKNISYKLDLDDNTGFAEVDPEQCRRVLSNLIANSEQSIGESGSIKVKVRRINSAESSNSDDLIDGPWVEWTFTDDGHGISPADLPQVFEPYFTTRQSANASGIGLTVCESIVKAHNGRITVKSEPGKGTQVTVRLPAMIPVVDATESAKPDTAAAPLKQPDTPEPPRPAASPAPRRVLILEDERLIRQLLAMNLTTGGYQVVATEEGSEAVAAFRDAYGTDTPFDLFITDLTIPEGMGGAQAMEQILAIDPEVRAIVSSGYSDDPVMARFMDYGFSAVLPKPYEPRQLLELVEEVLGSR